MNNSIETIIKESANRQIPAGLTAIIISKIQHLDRIRTRRKFFVFGLFSLASFGGLVVSFQNLWSSLQSSGTYEYLSLLVSNSGNIALFWKEISFSILESIPLITLSIFLALIITFIITSVKTVENINTKLITA